MNKKVVVLGGGTGLSCLLSGLKKFPLDITAVVSVCDDGSSTGKLRKEFKTPAVGDLRKVIISLSEVEPLVEKLLSYRFDKESSLEGHAMGNLLLTGLFDISDNMSKGIESLGTILNLKGTVLPLSDDFVELSAIMEDNSIIKGEHKITSSPLKINNVFYKKEPKINKLVIEKILNADAIVFSMGSLYTSLLPNLISKSIKKAINESNAKLIYCCNMMTQPGETQDFKVSDHVKVINQEIKPRYLDTIIINDGKINKKIVSKYETLEQKKLVIYDKQETKKLVKNIISDNLVIIKDKTIRHNTMKLAVHIFTNII
ncbi:MAG: gluconeogenesis factor YvcK family protein [Mycoplasmatota bacterium]